MILSARVFDYVRSYVSGSVQVYGTFWDSNQITTLVYSLASLARDSSSSHGVMTWTKLSACCGALYLEPKHRMIMIYWYIYLDYSSILRIHMNWQSRWATLSNLCVHWIANESLHCAQRKQLPGLVRQSRSSCSMMVLSICISVIIPTNNQ